MPKFFPDFADSAARPSDKPEVRAFLRGYLGAAEWLAYDDVPNDQGELCRVDDKVKPRRDKTRGWTRKAQVEARRDCLSFIRANRADLALYVEISGRTMESAGYDFHLSRNGHGAGFFDRGNGGVFDRLQDAARGFGEAEATLSRGGWFGWMR